MAFTDVSPHGFCGGVKTRCVSCTNAAAWRDFSLSDAQERQMKREGESDEEVLRES